MDTGWPLPAWVTWKSRSDWLARSSSSMKVPLRRVRVVHLSLSKVEAVADGGGQVCLEQAGGLVGVGENAAEEPVVGVVGVGHEGALVSAGCRLPAIVVRRRLVCRVRGGRQAAARVSRAAARGRRGRLPR